MVDSAGSARAAQAASSEADRFPVVNPVWWTRWSWLHLAFVVAWLVGWIAAGPYDRIPAILTGLAALAFFFWIIRKGQRSERPENNFIELGDSGMRIEAYGRTALRVRYAEILGVRPVARVSLLQRRLWMISKKDLAAYVEIELRGPRWLVVWTFPWRWKRVFLRLAQPMQFELALRARIDPLARRGTATPP